MGYYPPDESELKRLWSDGLVVLDTNALLNLFRYTESTSLEFLKILEAKKEQLWLPHQVGLEFHRRRIDVINAQRRAFSDVESALMAAKKAVQGTVNRYKRHPSMDTSALNNLLDESIDSLIANVKAADVRHAETVLANDHDNKILRSITDLYEGRVGPAYGDSELEELHKRGEERYEKLIPPGYKDKDKSEQHRYGDLILWEQILQRARELRLPAIFITDDAKEDWWRVIDGATQGPRVELIDEYWDAAQERIHFYSPDRFAEMFAKYSGSEISPESVAEVLKVSNARPDHQASIARRINALQREKFNLLQAASSSSRDRETLGQRSTSLLSFEARAIDRRLDETRNKVLNVEAEITRLRRLGEIADDEDQEYIATALDGLYGTKRSFHEEIESLQRSRQELEIQFRHRGGPDESDHIDLKDAEIRLGQIEEMIRQARAHLDGSSES